MKKMLVISVAGLDIETAAALSLPDGIQPIPLRPAFPAVTCSAQAAFRTGTPASHHGMVANGVYDRALRRCAFWEQSASLVEGPRLWDAARAAGRTVGMLFWQQSLGEAADYILSPAPIHKHHGGMLRDCYSHPRAMYTRLRESLGEFPLHRYWGPLASPAVGDWIGRATADVMAHEAPDLLLTYLPTLDYDFQRHGPQAPAAARSIARLVRQLERLFAACRRHDYAWLLWGDYAIEPTRAEGVLYPNRVLRDAGFLNGREVRGRLYADPYRSRAFAMVDHAVAHLFVPNPSDIPVVVRRLQDLDGVEQVLAGAQRDALGLTHSRCGEVVLVAAPGRWFAYPWWRRAGEAPDFASHVDIHAKPGFDPCELFRHWLPPGIGRNPLRVGGTHGRIDRSAAWAGSESFDRAPTTLIELSGALQRWLGSSLQDPPPQREDA